MMIIEHFTETPASVALDHNKHIQLPETDIQKVLMLALSVRNDLSKSKRAESFSSLQLPIQKLDFMIDELNSIVNKKDIDVHTLGIFKFIISRKLLIAGKHEQPLTQLETEILTMLCENRDSIIERDEMLNTIWGHSDFYTSRSLDVYMHRLRKYFALDPNILIETVHRKGFKFTILSNENFSVISS